MDIIALIRCPYNFTCIYEQTIKAMLNHFPSSCSSKLIWWNLIFTIFISYVSHIMKMTATVAKNNIKLQLSSYCQLSYEINSEISCIKYIN